MSINASRAWRLFIFCKCAYMLFALHVYSLFTTLGDTDRYIQAGFQFNSDALFSSTVMMDVVAGFFGEILGYTFGNLPFVALASYGIFYSVSRAGFCGKQLVFLLALLSAPSFGIWTSIASKEAVCVFWLGILLGSLFDLIYKRRINWILLFLALYLGFIFKPHYLACVVVVFVFIYLKNRLKLKRDGIFLLLIGIVSSLFYLLFLFSYEINELSFLMPANFSLDAGSTRENDIWVNDFDVFFNAPYGMYISLQGPTISEALNKPTHFLALIESWIVFGFLLAGLFKIGYLSARYSRFNLYFISIFCLAFLSMSFVHYPFGVLNPGSAIRYRSGFFAFWAVLFYWLYINSLVSFKAKSSLVPLYRRHFSNGLVRERGSIF